MKKEWCRRLIAWSMVLSLSAGMVACQKKDRANTPEENIPDHAEDLSMNDLTALLDTGYSKADGNDTESEDGMVHLTLADASSVADGEGVRMDGNVIMITAGGTYYVTGVLHDGQLRIGADTSEKVRLILGGVDISCTTDSPILAESADKVILTLCAGSENIIRDQDTREANDKDTRGRAAIYSEVSLTVNGKGSLTVNGSYKNGIATKKTLKILGGDIHITAKNVGLKGNNAIEIGGGEITINAQGDAIKTEETENETKGFILMDGGEVTINTAGDGFSASQYLLISGGKIDIVTTGEVSSSASRGNDFPGGIFPGDNFPGGRGNADGDTSDGVSSKGLKAEKAVSISGGEICVQSTGHCIHSAGTLLVSGTPTLSLSSSRGKGIASHGDMQLDGGNIQVLKSTEGLESKTFLTINGGDISLLSSDDGINAGGQVESATGLIFNGGYVTVNANGDGLDSNGDITFNSGTVVVAGSTSGGDGPLDCGERSNIFCNGGIMIAYGSIFQANADNPAFSSLQGSIRASLSAAAGTLVTLKDSDGQVLVSVTLEKAISNIYISTPEMTVGKTYILSTGGTNTKVAGAGNLTVGGDVSGDKDVVTITLKEVFSSNMSTGGGMGGPGGRDPGDMGGPGGRDPGDMGGPGGRDPGGRDPGGQGGWW